MPRTQTITDWPNLTRWWVRVFAVPGCAKPLLWPDKRGECSSDKDTAGRTLSLSVPARGWIYRLSLLPRYRGEWPTHTGFCIWGVNGKPDQKLIQRTLISPDKLPGHIILSRLSLQGSHFYGCYYRILEWFRLKGTLNVIQFHLLPWCHQAAPSPIQTDLEHFQRQGNIFLPIEC